PTQERYLMTREELLDRICVLLGGRAAEEIACNDISTGAEDDLERATEMARQMVCRFGMSHALGPMTFGNNSAQRPSAWLPGSGEPYSRSEATARLIDTEVKAIMTREHARAHDQLIRQRNALDAIAGELLTRETLQQAELLAIAQQ